MSIYGSTWTADANDHAKDCAVWLECACPDPHAHRRGMLGDGRHWLYLDAATCTCRCGPIVYQGSHILPSTEDKRGGTFGFGEIAGFITRDGRDDGPENEDTPWPYLRVTMRAEDAEDCQDVVLDRQSVLSMRDYLSDWLAATDPTETHVPRWHGPSGDVYPLAVQ